MTCSFPIFPHFADQNSWRSFGAAPDCQTATIVAVVPDVSN
jgi:hypothetical protein